MPGSKRKASEISEDVSPASLPPQEIASLLMEYMDMVTANNAANVCKGWRSVFTPNEYMRVYCVRRGIDPAMGLRLGLRTYMALYNPWKNPPVNVIESEEDPESMSVPGINARRRPTPQGHIIECKFLVGKETSNFPVPDRYNIKNLPQAAYGRNVLLCHWEGGILIFINHVWISDAKGFVTRYKYVRMPLPRPPIVSSMSGFACCWFVFRHPDGLVVCSAVCKSKHTVIDVTYHRDREDLGADPIMLQVHPRDPMAVIIETTPPFVHRINAPSDRSLEPDIYQTRAGKYIAFDPRTRTLSYNFMPSFSSAMHATCADRAAQLWNSEVTLHSLGYITHLLYKRQIANHFIVANDLQIGRRKAPPEDALKHWNPVL